LLALASSSSAASEPPSRETIARVNRLGRDIISEVRRELAGDEDASLTALTDELSEAAASLFHRDELSEVANEIGFWARAVAIAKGEVPQHHWFHLGRLVTNIDGRATLMSWGGTMFEYLMPQLLLRGYPGTLLDESCRASVRRQIEYGKERSVPWGISESAYAFTDRAGNYQYKAFGVPGLGFKRGLADDLVVSPYATALAGLIDPAAAVSNFTRLARTGLDGRFGFYESIDYRPR